MCPHREWDSVRLRVAYALTAKVQAEPSTLEPARLVAPVLTRVATRTPYRPHDLVPFDLLGAVAGMILDH